MRSLLLQWRKSLIIIIGALVISTLGIQASDEFSGISSRLSGLVIEADGGCGKFAIPILFGSHTICMDTYEASPSSDCPYEATNSEIETQANLAVGACKAISVSEVVPWRFVTYTQAQQLCARDRKRLPTNEEWYKVAIGLGDTSSCFKSKGSEPSKTGQSLCVTPTGIHDLVGNVWEWSNDVLTDGVYKERELPPSGYVKLVDGEGVVIETTNTPDKNFGEDYAQVNEIGVKGILRGGFYGSGSDGGIFAQNLSVPLDFTAVGVGFRCVRDL